MNILLITPPLTQLNTTYPATTYLKGFLQTKGYQVHQCDLGIELINKIFTRSFLQKIFQETATTFNIKSSAPNIRHIFAEQQRYLDTIEPVMRFLRNEDPTLATRICLDHFLPRAYRFSQLADTEWAFGALGIIDKARHFATLYIEDLSDFIRDTICPYFELNRYAEKLCLYIPEFELLDITLKSSTSIIDHMMLSILDNEIKVWKPDVIGFSIPFPGNLYGALKCGQYIKFTHPGLKIVLGGGYVNTELRQLTDPGIFNYCDYILLDDGEPSLLCLLEHLEGKRSENDLVHTFVKAKNNQVTFINSTNVPVISFEDTGVPDYSDLPLHKYLSMIELTNPMHKLWSDGRWNKLTLAKGCYWAKCAFCDTSLPYISCYEPASAKTTANRIESIIQQTHQTGFHFTDEAAPPKILRELSSEIIRRSLIISWWGNIRFEKAFSDELCNMMSKAGCIAVSGGIEVASDRILKLINKGISIEQAVISAFNLTQNDIMVHAYLMYGFPTETVQETIDSLEIVRQMFNEGLIQSAFWHRYAMTLHSPTGIKPENYGAKRYKKEPGSFANNEIPFTDGQSIDLDELGNGLRKATFNYMHGLCLDWPVFRWFKINVPKTTIKPNYIRKIIG
jgi:radical SAM superfamily enzyme YgiQ (UPF0313 family)